METKTETIETIILKNSPDLAWLYLNDLEKQKKVKSHEEKT